MLIAPAVHKICALENQLIFFLHTKNKIKIYENHLASWVSISFKFGTKIVLVLDFISMKIDKFWSIYERVIGNNIKIFLQFSVTPPE